MNERTMAGEQGSEGQRTETQAADIGGESETASNENDYLLFANSSRSYFQFQVKDADSAN